MEGAKIPEKRERKLHSAMVRCSRIQRADHESLNPCTRETMQIWKHDYNPPKLVAEPHAVGQVFSKSLTSPGGDPSFTVDEDTLNAHLAWVPKCTPGNSSKSLRSPDHECFLRTIEAANLTKATGEDDRNYYVVSVCPPAIQQLFLSAIPHVVHNGPPKKWSTSRVCLVYKKEDPREAENCRLICLIQMIVNLSAAWLCKHLTHEVQQHSFLHPCQHGGAPSHRCWDHIYAWWLERGRAIPFIY